MPFPHGTDAAGLPPIGAWQDFAGRARRAGAFLGFDPDVHPAHFSIIARYAGAMRGIEPHHPRRRRCRWRVSSGWSRLPAPGPCASRPDAGRAQGPVCASSAQERTSAASPAVIRASLSWSTLSGVSSGVW